MNRSTILSTQSIAAKFKHLHALLLAMVMILDGGCGTWLGNPTNPDDDKTPKTDVSTPPNPDSGIPATESAVSLAFHGVKPLNLLSSLQVVGKNGDYIGTLLLEKTLVVLGSIEFENADGFDHSGEIDFSGPFLVNLLDDSVAPEPAVKNLPAGLYTEIKLKMEKLHSDEANTISSAIAEELVDKSILIQGTFVTINGQEKSFDMSFSLDEEFSLIDDNGGIELLGGTTQNIVIAFNLESWFDFSNTETNSDGWDFSDITSSSIVLSEDGEDAVKSVHEVIKENIKKSSEFGKDEDDDGEIDEWD